jgi:hypothetical protein
VVIDEEQCSTDADVETPMMLSDRGRAVIGVALWTPHRPERDPRSATGLNDAAPTA